MSAGSRRRHESLHPVALTSLSDELDELLRTTRRYDDPEPAEDLEAYSDDEEDQDRICVFKPCTRSATDDSEFCRVHRDGKRHGHADTYRAGCRCSECREAWRVWFARYQGREVAPRESASTPPAIPAETPAPEEVSAVAITSGERVSFERLALGGRASKGPRPGRLKVPRDIAELIPEGTEFAVEISEQGIVFKPAAMVQEQRAAALPAWAKNGRH